MKFMFWIVVSVNLFVSSTPLSITDENSIVDGHNEDKVRKLHLSDIQSATILLVILQTKRFVCFPAP